MDGMHGAGETSAGGARVRMRVVLLGGGGETLEEIEDDEGRLAPLLPERAGDADQVPSRERLAEEGVVILDGTTIDLFLPEWSRVTERCRTSAEECVVSRIEELARACQNDPSLSLAFHWDD